MFLSVLRSCYMFIASVICCITCQKVVLFAETGCKKATQGVVSVLLGPTNVLCVYNWIVLTQRFDGALDFNRLWANYKQGFGSNNIPNGNFWLGLKKMHPLTETNTYRLRFLLQSYSSSQWFYADYDRITIAAEASKYR